MRLLHTSDWHLGRTLHGADLLDHQATVLDLLVDTVVRESVDVVLVAGDIYDRSVPPTAAVALLDQALGRLADHAAVVLTSGNHDSATRLGFGAALFGRGVHVRTSADMAGVPVEFEDEHGLVAIYPLPFLNPDIARYRLAGAEGEPLARSHQACLVEAMRRIDIDRLRLPQGTRRVVMAHAFVVGGSRPAASDSERDISVGGVDAVSDSVFDGIDYVALGHLHGAQEPKTDGSHTLRYSGSPLRFSFSEAAQDKSFTLVDLGAGGVAQITTIPVPQPREMAILQGSIDDLLDPTGYQEHVDSWVQVTVTDESRPSAMYERLRERFPHALVVRHQPAGGPLVVGGVAPRNPADAVSVTRQFVEYVTGAPASTAEVDAFRSAYEVVRDAMGDR